MPSGRHLLLSGYRVTGPPRDGNGRAVGPRLLLFGPSAYQSGWPWAAALPRAEYCLSICPFYAGGAIWPAFLPPILAARCWPSRLACLAPAPASPCRLGPSHCHRSSGLPRSGSATQCRCPLFLTRPELALRIAVCLLLAPASVVDHRRAPAAASVAGRHTSGRSAVTGALHPLRRDVPPGPEDARLPVAHLRWGHSQPEGRRHSPGKECDKDTLRAGRVALSLTGRPDHMLAYLLAYFTRPAHCRRSRPPRRSPGPPCGTPDPHSRRPRAPYRRRSQTR